MANTPTPWELRKTDFGIEIGAVLQCVNGLTAFVTLLEVVNDEGTNEIVGEAIDFEANAEFVVAAVNAAPGGVTVQEFARTTLDGAPSPAPEVAELTGALREKNDPQIIVEALAKAARERETALATTSQMLSALYEARGALRGVKLTDSDDPADVSEDQSTMEAVRRRIDDAIEDAEQAAPPPAERVAELVEGLRWLLDERHGSREEASALIAKHTPGEATP